MVAYKTLLVPTDFSHYTQIALDHARALAQAFSACVVLLHVIPEESRELLFRTAADGHLEDAETVFQNMIEASQLQLERFLADMEEARVKRLVLVGHPVLEIVKLARSEGADLIVIPTHGRTGVSHVLFGSVAEKVIRKAPCPVLVVRASGSREPQGT